MGLGDGTQRMSHYNERETKNGSAGLRIVGEDGKSM